MEGGVRNTGDFMSGVGKKGSSLSYQEELSTHPFCCPIKLS